jgi:hypothetical protein
MHSEEWKNRRRKSLSKAFQALSDSTFSRTKMRFTYTWNDIEAKLDQIGWACEHCKKDNIRFKAYWLPDVTTREAMTANNTFVVCFHQLCKYPPLHKTSALPRLVKTRLTEIAPDAVELLHLERSQNDLPRLGARVLSRYR